MSKTLLTGLITSALVLSAVAGATAEGRADLAHACDANDVPEDGFEDLPQGSTHEFAVDCIVWWLVATGVDERTYGGTAAVTRGQMATFVARALDVAGAELPSDPPDRFIDDDGNTHEAAINALAELGVVSGYSQERYEPRLAVSREQMATFLVRSYETITGQPAPAGTDDFDDDDGSTHEPAIRSVSALEIAAGVASRRFAPRDPVTRAQMGSFVARLLDIVAERGIAVPPQPPTDSPQPDYPAYESPAEQEPTPSSEPSAPKPAEPTHWPATNNGDSCDNGSLDRVRVAVDGSVPALFDRLATQTGDEQLATAVEIMRRSGPLPAWIATSSTTSGEFRDWFGRMQAETRDVRGWTSSLGTAYHETIHAAQWALGASGYSNCMITGPGEGFNVPGVRSAWSDTVAGRVLRDRISATITDDFTRDFALDVSYLYFGDPGNCPSEAGHGCGARTFDGVLREANAYALDDELVAAWDDAGVDTWGANEARAVVFAGLNIYLHELRRIDPPAWRALHDGGYPRLAEAAWVQHDGNRFASPELFRLGHRSYRDALEEFTAGRVSATE